MYKVVLQIHAALEVDPAMKFLEGTCGCVRGVQCVSITGGGFGVRRCTAREDTRCTTLRKKSAGAPTWPEARSIAVCKECAHIACTQGGNTDVHRATNNEPCHNHTASLPCPTMLGRVCHSRRVLAHSRKQRCEWRENWHVMRRLLGLFLAASASCMCCCLHATCQHTNTPTSSNGVCQHIQAKLLANHTDTHASVLRVLMLSAHNLRAPPAAQGHMRGRKTNPKNNTREARGHCRVTTGHTGGVCWCWCWCWWLHSLGAVLLRVSLPRVAAARFAGRSEAHCCALACCLACRPGAACYCHSLPGLSRPHRYRLGPQARETNTRR